MERDAITTGDQMRLIRYIVFTRRTVSSWILRRTLGQPLNGGGVKKGILFDVEEAYGGESYAGAEDACLPAEGEEGVEEC